MIYHINSSSPEARTLECLTRTLDEEKLNGVPGRRVSADLQPNHLDASHSAPCSPSVNSNISRTRVTTRMRRLNTSKMRWALCRRVLILSQSEPSR
jgi:hypothetical protein